MPVTFGPSGSTALKTEIIVSWKSLCGLTNSSRNHSLWTHFTIQSTDKALSCKLEAVHETLSSSLGQKSFKIIWSKVQSCSVVAWIQMLFISLENMDAASSGLKRWGTVHLVTIAQFKSPHLWWHGGVSVPVELAACVIDWFYHNTNHQ